jgi:hypothetical protein
VALPPFNDEGELPQGVHRATLREVVRRFGKGSAVRQRLARRLKQLHELADSTGHLARFVVYGSFVTAKAAPRDLDIVLVMDDSFDLSELTGEAAILFRHQDADAHFGASVFLGTSDFRFRRGASDD